MTDNFKQLLTKDELKPFLERSNRAAIGGLLVNYGLIMLAFALPALWLNPLTILLSLILLGNRQLGLGILMHDCAHSAFFESKLANQRAGEWLCAAPILAQFDGYRQYHLRHHAKAGTTADPDYPNYQPYPIKPSSLRRKIFRDLVGITGLKNLAAIFLMHSDKLTFDMSYKAKGDDRHLTVGDIAGNLVRHLYQAVIVHAFMISILISLGQGWLYLLWWVAFLTTFQLFSRIRNAAEHANVPDLLSKDPRLHARTTYANWWERLTVAPNHVNYHLEHHWIATVPPYRLADFHAFLKAKHALDDVKIFPGYRSVLKAMTA